MAFSDFISETGEWFFFVPLYVLVPVLLGTIWYPGAALSCALIAYWKRLDIKYCTIMGGFLSCLFVLPWLYFIFRMVFGKRFPTVLVLPLAVSMYVFVYAIWFLGYLLYFNAAHLMVGVIDIFLLHAVPVEIALPFVIGLGLMLPINILTFAWSLRSLMQTYRGTSEAWKKNGTPVLSSGYLAPFVGLIGWSIVVLLSMLIVGLAGYTQT